MRNKHPNRFQVAGATPRLRRAVWILALCSLLVAGSALAQGRTRAITEALETGTDLVTLPSVPGGTLVATQCRGCPTLRLSFAPDTRYYIGNEAVSYARLREAAGKGDIQLYVSYRLDNRTLTRLRLVATGNEK